MVGHFLFVHRMDMEEVSLHSSLLAIKNGVIDQIRIHSNNHDNDKLDKVNNYYIHIKPSHSRLARMLINLRTVQQEPGM